MATNGQREVVIRCPLNHFQCIGTRKCIHFNKLCNGARDCDDGYDEGVHCRDPHTVALEPPERVRRALKTPPCHVDGS
ncbi:unnamed protein product [Boreogadus saida]